jgi:hypothetical protein
MAIATLTFTDVDLETGQFKAELEVVDSKLDDGFMTAAHMTATFVATHLSNPAFQRMALDWAASIASNPGCSIGNLDHLPGIDDDEAGNATEAA